MPVEPPSEIPHSWNSSPDIMEGICKIYGSEKWSNLSFNEGIYLTKSYGGIKSYYHPPVFFLQTSLIQTRETDVWEKQQKTEVDRMTRWGGDKERTQCAMFRFLWNAYSVFYNTVLMKVHCKNDACHIRVSSLTMRSRHIIKME